MSVKATNFVRKLRGLTADEKAVAFSLADHDSYEGRGAYPSMQTLAHCAGLKNRETASRITKRLLDAGVLFTDSHSKGGRGKTTVYRFNFSLENCDSRITLSGETALRTVTEESRFTNKTVTLKNGNCDFGRAIFPETVTLEAETVTVESHEGLKGLREGKRRKEGKPSEEPSLSRFSFENDWDIPTEIFLEVWPCPNTEGEAYGWLDHCRLRLGDALCSRNHWVEKKRELLKSPESFTEYTLPELDERIIAMIDACSECEQLVQDAVQEFEDVGYSLEEYHAASTLRLFSTRQVLDAGHTY